MGWIIPAVLGIAGLFGQNSANKSAQANNSNQQQQQEAWVTQQRQNAQDYMSPWLVPGSTPFFNQNAGAKPSGPTPGGSLTPQIMGANNPMAGAAPPQAPTPTFQPAPPAGFNGGQIPPMQPPQPQQISPQQMAIFQQAMRGFGGGLRRPAMGSPQGIQSIMGMQRAM